VLRPFVLDRPATLGEVADLLTAHREDTVLYAAGTELVLLLMKEGLVRPRRLIDVKAVRDQRRIARAGSDTPPHPAFSPETGARDAAERRIAREGGRAHG